MKRLLPVLRNRIFLITLGVMMVQGLSCFGQTAPDTAITYRIETRDGNVFVGKITGEDSLRVTLQTERLGELSIPRADITGRTLIAGAQKVDGQLWLPNPQSTRYFWAPNGYGLEKGEGYYQNIWILYNQVSVGLTKNFSIGAGMLPLFLFAGAPTPIFLVPKFSFPLVKDKFNLGTGAFLGTILGEETGVFGLLYGTATIGSHDKNLSFGMAYGFSRESWMDTPIFNISGMVRVGPKGYLISENYVISGGGETFVFMSFGGRTIFRNVGLDYSLWIPAGLGLERLMAIPFLGITLPIGRGK